MSSRASPGAPGRVEGPAFALQRTSYSAPELNSHHNQSTIHSMAAARVAAACLAAFLPVAGAQQTSQTHLTIQVTDRTGAVVPGAQVRIDPSSPAIDSGLSTD